mmetsp:Transcript_36396/g.95968  ORF Transcript_36396/g.95968 Transcript_36396/m.95968 type:complete len:163 (-) Transcript_36396:1131-1619(-)
MIYYWRTSWYGFHYFLRSRGSLIPRCLPAIAIAGVISGITASGIIEDHLGVSTVLGDTFAEAYAMQLFGVVFGFLSVTRLNMSYQRYWEGISSIKTMYSKWGDAAVQVITFDSSSSHAIGCGNDEFREHIVRLFCQLSAVATITLHITDFAGFEVDGACVTT